MSKKAKHFFNVGIVTSSGGNRAQEVSVYDDISTEGVNIEYLKMLQKDLSMYEIDLATVLEEAKEFKRLSLHYPKLHEKLKQHHIQANKRSIKLLGKINALQILLRKEQ